MAIFLWCFRMILLISFVPLLDMRESRLIPRVAVLLIISRLFPKLTIFVTRSSRPQITWRYPLSWVLLCRSPDWWAILPIVLALWRTKDTVCALTRTTFLPCPSYRVITRPPRFRARASARIPLKASRWSQQCRLARTTGSWSQARWSSSAIRTTKRTQITRFWATRSLSVPSFLSLPCRAVQVRRVSARPEHRARQIHPSRGPNRDDARDSGAGSRAAQSPHIPVDFHPLDSPLATDDPKWQATTWCIAWRTSCGTRWTCRNGTDRTGSPTKWATKSEFSA